MDVEGDWWLLIEDAPPDRAVKLTLRDWQAVANYGEGHDCLGTYKVEADRVVVTIATPTEPVFAREAANYQIGLLPVSWTPR